MIYPMLLGLCWREKKPFQKSSFLLSWICMRSMHWSLIMYIYEDFGHCLGVSKMDYLKKFGKRKSWSQLFRGELWLRHVLTFINGIRKGNSALIYGVLWSDNLSKAYQSLHKDYDNILTEASSSSSSSKMVSQCNAELCIVCFG